MVREHLPRHNPAMSSDTWNLLVLSLLWVGYGALHSLAASRGAKAWASATFPRWVHGYRLVYNLAAVLLLGPVLAWLYLHPGGWLWRWEGGAAWLADGFGLAAAGYLLLGPGLYDLQEFLGLRALRARRPALEDQDAFRITPLHRFVRHPWYALSLVVLWTRDMSEARLVSAAWVTLYILVGSRLEEAKLAVRFGSGYRRYREQVPAFLPSPWRWLNQAAAAALEAEATGAASSDTGVN